MENVFIKILNKSPHPLPAYSTVGSAGMDLRANLTNSINLHPMERMMISTGIYLEIPFGYEAQIRPRSGLAAKHGITCLNSPGTIDSDYRGEIKVILINLSQELQQVNHGDRIAQLIVSKVERAIWELVAELNETQRGEGGFGHTGTH